MLQRGGPFLLPIQLFLTLSHTQCSFPAPPTAKENSLTDPSPEALLPGQASMAIPPAKSEPYLSGRGREQRSLFLLCGSNPLGLHPAWARTEEGVFEDQPSGQGGGR